MGFLTPEKSIDEVEQETEKLEAEDRNEGMKLSITQKRAAAAELKSRGLTPKHFNNRWSNILQWLKTH